MIIFSKNILKNHYIIYQIIQLKQDLYFFLYNLYNQDELKSILDQHRI
jgi:hypothetical protein